MCRLLMLWTWALALTMARPDRLAPAEGPAEDRVTQSDLTMATEYLQHYYDLQFAPQRRRKRSDSALTSKVRDMQSFFGLNATGHLDLETLEIMKAPRCGVPDVHEYVTNQGAKWNKDTISYRVVRYTPDLPAATVDHEIAAALNIWSSSSQLKFVRSSTAQADILVDFAEKWHGDYYPFDGPRGTLAHAFGPGEGIGGDTHFDEGENWTTTSEGYNLFLVAAHEFGHALGLSHSSNPSSLMYPTYKQRDRNNVLSREDINKISSLYRPTATALARRPQRYGNWFLGQRFVYRMRDRCGPRLAFDAVTSLEESVLLFRGRYLWIKHNQEQDDIKVAPIRKFLPTIQSGIDAAYTIPSKSSLYLFTGSTFWTVKGTRAQSRPKPIHRFGLPREVEKIDAAVHVNTSGETLIFAQGLYWSYDENRRTMEDSSPRNTSDDFPGIKTPVDAAVYKDGFIHFFHGPEVCKYDTSRKCIVGVDKVNSWLGCKTKSPLKRQLRREPVFTNLCQNAQQMPHLA